MMIKGLDIRTPEFGSRDFVYNRGEYLGCLGLVLGIVALGYRVVCLGNIKRLWGILSIPCECEYVVRWGDCGQIWPVVLILSPSYKGLGKESSHKSSF